MCFHRWNVMHFGAHSSQYVFHKSAHSMERWNMRIISGIAVDWMS